jgi:hypothetical protein
MRFIKGDSLKEAIEHFHRDDTLQSHPGRRWSFVVGARSGLT